MARTDRIGRKETNISRLDDGTICVTYHNTVVVMILPTGAIILDTGGWWTATTKSRMNQTSNQFGLGFYVEQRDYRWTVWIDGQGIPFNTTPLRIRNGHSY